MKTNCSGSKPSQLKTFWADMMQLGITEQKRITYKWCKSIASSSAVLYLEEVAEGFKKIFGAVPPELDRWVTATDAWKVTKKKYITEESEGLMFVEPMNQGVNGIRVV